MALVHYKGPYNRRTACKRTGKMQSETSEDWMKVTCPKCKAARAAHGERTADLGNFEPTHDMVGNARRLPKQEGVTSKMTLGEVRELVRDVIREVSEPIKIKVLKAYGPGGGGHVVYTGERNAIMTALIMADVSKEKRDAILAGESAAPPKVAVLLKKRGAAVPYKAPEAPKGPPAPRAKRPMTARAAEGAFAKAVKEFAKNWEGFTADMPDTSPEDAAPDAALGFFEMNPEWRQWERAMGGPRDVDLKGAVVDAVYDAMVKGQKKRASK